MDRRTLERMMRQTIAARSVLRMANRDQRIFPNAVGSDPESDSHRDRDPDKAPHEAGSGIGLPCIGGHAEKVKNGSGLDGGIGGAPFAAHERWIPDSSAATT